MIKAELILDTRSKSKNGYPVKIRIYDTLAKTKSPHKYVNLKVYQNNLDLKLDPFLRRRAADLDNEVNFCNENFYKLDEAVDLIKNGIPPDDIDLEIELLEKKLEILKKKKGIQKGVGFIEFTNTLIAERKIKKIPTDSYTRIIKSVESFITPKLDIPINSITKEWVNDYDLFFKEKKLTDSSIHTYISIIRAIYREAQTRESLNIKSDNPFNKLRNFKKEKIESELTIDDLIKIKNLSINDIKTRSNIGSFGIKRLADIFLFQFAIGGQDMAEIGMLKWSNIKDGRVKIKRHKNRFKKSSGEYIDNKLNDFCLNVIETYGDKQDERVFSFLINPDLEMNRYRNQINKFNKVGFSVLAKTIGSTNTFTTKSTRYLFRTEGGNLLVDSYILMKLQGHSPKGITFGYQGALNYDVQDREHQKILDLVFKE